MNDPATVNVRSGPVRSGSAVERTPHDLLPDAPVDPPGNPVEEDAERAENPRLLDWVPAGEPAHATAGDYPIEGGVPHPHWNREPAQHSLGTHPVVVAESGAVVRMLVGLAVAAFLLGLTIFYPVSPLGH